MSQVEDFLEHYGVKGMKWGVRKDRNERERKATFGASKDAKRAARAVKKARSSGIKSLTNQELKDLNSRLQLEQQYQQITAKQSTGLGQKFAKKAASEVGNLAMGAVRSQAQSQLNKQLSELLNKKK